MVAIPQWGNSDRELGCKLAAVWVAAFLELEAASAAETEAADDDAIAADDEEAMDDVTASASVVSARGMSIREEGVQSGTRLTNCAEGRLGNLRAV
jgi:hypothetical protein